MAADELTVQMVEHVGDGEMALVRGHLGVEEHLQEQVAELFRQMGEIPALDGVEDLVGLFECVFANGIEGLFAVPRATAGARSRAMMATDCSNNSAARAWSVGMGPKGRPGAGSFALEPLAADPCTSSLRRAAGRRRRMRPTARSTRLT